MSRPDWSLGGVGGGAGAVALDIFAKLGAGPVASTLSYCASSISMTVVNKYVVSGNKWNMNFLFLVVQSLIGVVTLVIGREAGLIKNLAAFSKSKAQQWFPVSLCLVGMVYTGNMALRFLSVPVYTIFKNLTIIVIAYGEVFWFAGVVTPSIALSFGLMIFSSVVAAWADFQYAASHPSGGKTAESLAILIAGFIWMTLNIFCSAAYALSLRKFTQGTDFSNWDIMYYNNLLIFPVTCLATLILEDWSSDNLRQNFPPETRYTMPMGMIYSGLGALAITYCTTWVIRTTSSTTYAMIGALNKLPLAICGIVFFASPVTFGGVSAIALGFISGLVYAWAKIRSSSAPPPPKSEIEIPLTEAQEGGADSESGSDREGGSPRRS